MDGGDRELSSLSEKKHCPTVRAKQQKNNNSYMAAINGESRPIIFQITLLI